MEGETVGTVEVRSGPTLIQLKLGVNENVGATIQSLRRFVFNQRDAVRYRQTTEEAGPRRSGGPTRFNEEFRVQSGTGSGGVLNGRGTRWRAMLYRSSRRT